MHRGVLKYPGRSKRSCLVGSWLPRWRQGWILAAILVASIAASYVQSGVGCTIAGPALDVGGRRKPPPNLSGSNTSMQVQKATSGAAKLAPRKGRGRPPMGGVRCVSQATNRTKLRLGAKRPVLASQARNSSTAKPIRETCAVCRAAEASHARAIGEPGGEKRWAPQRLCRMCRKKAPRAAEFVPLRGKCVECPHIAVYGTNSAKTGASIIAASLHPSNIKSSLHPSSLISAPRLAPTGG